MLKLYLCAGEGAKSWLTLIPLLLSRLDKDMSGENLWRGCVELRNLCKERRPCVRGLSEFVFLGRNQSYACPEEPKGMFTGRIFLTPEIQCRIHI